MQVFIGPLSEIQGGGDANQAIVIKSSGRFDEQRISFTVDRNTMGSPNFTRITIYNLTESTRQIIAKSGTNVLLQAGYKQGNLAIQTISRGAIASSISERSQGDVVTTINVYDGLQGLGVGRFSKSYNGQQKLSKIIGDIARQIPGVTVNSQEIQLGNQTLGKKGLSLNGRCNNLLDRLSRQWGFSWSIQNGVFKAIPDEATTGSTFDVSTELGNLLHTTPRIDNVLQVVTGVEIKSILDPRMQPFDKVNLTSSVSPSLNNTYQITNLTHAGDTHGVQWTTTMQCLYNIGQIQPSQVQ